MVVRLNSLAPEEGEFRKWRCRAVRPTYPGMLSGMRRYAISRDRKRVARLSMSLTRNIQFPKDNFISNQKLHANIAQRAGKKGSPVFICRQICLFFYLKNTWHTKSTNI